MIFETEKGQPVWNVGYPQDRVFELVPIVSAIFLNLSEDEIQSGEYKRRGFNRQRNLLIFAHITTSLQRGGSRQPTAFFCGRLYQNIFRL